MARLPIRKPEKNMKRNVRLTMNLQAFTDSFFGNERKYAKTIITFFDFDRFSPKNLGG